MPAPTPIPEHLLNEPFHRDELVAAGLSPKILLDQRFQRVFPSVWRSAKFDLSHLQLLRAAVKSLPADASLSHISRIQSLDLDIGRRAPIHFTIARDHHLRIGGVFLHRTAAMPPITPEGVVPAAAFIQCCADMDLIELVAIGDWLLHEGLMTVPQLRKMISQQRWRPGARQARRVIKHLDGDSRSPQESRLRMCVVSCGLPRPEVNASICDEHGERVAIVDLLFRAWRLVLEYEGRQHAEDVTQFQRDISRYAELRRLDIEYLQVTSAMYQQTRALMLTVHRRLRELGYQGPPPNFGARWSALFAPVSIS